MSFDGKVYDVQGALEEAGLDGWLFYDFRRSNELACQFLEISSEKLLTRRFFYWLPSEGVPIKIVHAIEENSLDHLPGVVLSYRTWQQLESHLATALEGSQKIAMEYSPRNAIPYISKVDAGTMDVVRGLGVEVVSSADLLQKYTSVWDSYKLQTHLAAAEVLNQTVGAAWGFIASSLKEGVAINELMVQQFILNEFAKRNCMTSDKPICAVNAHSADPHYTPEKGKAASIKMGDFILIDLWCKQNLPNAVYADITRVGVAASKPTPKQQAIFDLVELARDTAVDWIKTGYSQGIAMMGCEVDDVCRDVIRKAGYDSYFIHRTGHNIDLNDHGNGANIDNLETRDCRLLLPGTCFSIEPGIYLPGEFGVRLEYDVYLGLDGQVHITGGIQDSIETLVANKT